MNNLFIRQSFIGYIIKIAGVVVIGWGVIQGIVSLVMMAQMGGSYMNEWGEINYASGMTGAALFAFLGVVGSHFLYGVLIIGFGEIIDTLQKIYFTMNPKAKQQWEEEKKEKEIAAFDEEVPFWVEQEVKGFYEKQQLNVQSIKKTSDPYIFKVSVDERVEYMEVGNFEPRILSEEEAAKFK